ncbi:MAG: hypothetical protein JST30_03270 [Armatimonadetes bacterium]|nr:hypothetical protein [Armatimonadota bacterium]
MAEAGVRVVVVPPGTLGLLEGLRFAVRPDSWVAAYHDPTLKPVSEFLQESEPDAEALSFADLIGKVIRVLGMTTERVATRGQREAMAALACDSLEGTTTIERAATLPGMAALIESRLEELRHYGIEPDDLKGIAATGAPALREKLEAMVRVSELVRDSMEVSHRVYVTDRIRACFDADAPDLSAVRHVVAVAASEDRPMYDGFLSWLARHGVPVDLIVCLVPERTDLFRPAQRTASRSGAKSTKVLGERPWYSELFRGVASDERPTVSIDLAPDPLAECEWILRECHRLHADGLLYPEIGVFVRDPGHYVPFLLSSARRLGVPVHCSRTVPLLSCGIASTVLRALKGIAGRDVREIARLAFGTYCPTPHGSADELLGHTKATWRHGASSWTRLKAWSDVRTERLPWLDALLAWRDAHLGATLPLSTWLEDFRTLVGETGLWEAASEGHPDVTARDERAQTVLQRSLADRAFVYDQAGLKELSLQGFASLAERIWREETVTFETGVGGVSVSSDIDALPLLSTLFVPGMLEGTIPRRRKEDPLFHDGERATVSESTGSFLPLSADTARTERDLFVRICAAAQAALVFSYPLTDDDRENVPAFFLDELERCVGGRVTRRTFPRSLSVPDAEDAVLDADRRIREALDGQRDYAGPEMVKADRARNALRPDWDVGVRVEELETAGRCAFQAAFRHRLKVRPPDRAVGTAVLADLPRRAGLVLAADAKDAGQRLRAELDALLDDLSTDMADWELGLLRATGLRWIEGWVDREFRARELWPRTPGSVRHDVGLDAEGLRSDPKVGDRRIKILAKVSAVYDIGGVSVVQDYSPGGPDLRNFVEDLDQSGESLKEGLLLLAQTHRSERGVAIEIDGGFDRRLFGLTPSDAMFLRGDATAGLAVYGLGSKATLVNRVFDRLKHTVSVLDRADARAVPGRPCETCLYGDLCRRSAVFGIETSPFGEDVET